MLLWLLIIFSQKFYLLQQSPMVQSINQRIAREAKKTIIPLIALHFFGFVLILGYRYHTRSHYSSEAAAARLVAAITEVPTTLVNSRIIVKKKVENRNPMEQYEEPIQRLSKELSKAQECVRIDTEQILQHLETLESIEQNNVITQDLLLLSTTAGEDNDDSDDGNKITKEVVLDSDVKSALYHWRGLISIGSLRGIPFDGLEESFHNVTKEIKAIEKSLDDEKLMEQFMFDTSLGELIVKEPSVFICPTHSENSESESEKNRDSSAHAYENDLHHYLEKFEEKFSNRAQGRGINALLPESIEQLEDIMESKMKIISEDIINVADDLEGKLDQITTGVKGSTSSSSSVDSSCVDKEFVHTLVEAGLQALLTHGDVREALRKTTLQLDPKTLEDELILDADLPLIDESHIKSYGNDAMKSINIRSKIDTPLLMKSVDWIDHFIDAIGGYNDGLDQYLDSLTDYRGSNSVGELVVENILEQATLVGDVNVQEYLQKLREMKTHLFQSSK